jgi:hypothetical protein
VNDRDLVQVPYTDEHGMLHLARYDLSINRISPCRLIYGGVGKKKTPKEAKKPKVPQALKHARCCPRSRRGRRRRRRAANGKRVETKTAKRKGNGSRVVRPWEEVMTGLTAATAVAKLRLLALVCAARCVWCVSCDGNRVPPDNTQFPMLSAFFDGSNQIYYLF